MHHARMAGLLLVAACASGLDSTTQLRNAVDEFHDGFRWGAMGSMLPHIPAESQGQFADVYGAVMAGISIADYEVSRVSLDEDSETAEVWIQVAWYSQTEMDLHQAVVREKWVSSCVDWLRTEAYVAQGELPGIPPLPAPEEPTPQPAVPGTP